MLQKGHFTSTFTSKMSGVSDDIYAPPESACKAPTETMKAIQAIANFSDKREPFSQCKFPDFFALRIINHDNNGHSSRCPDIQSMMTICVIGLYGLPAIPRFLFVKRINENRDIPHPPKIGTPNPNQKPWNFCLASSLTKIDTLTRSEIEIHLNGYTQSLEQS